MEKHLCEIVVMEKTRRGTRLYCGICLKTWTRYRAMIFLKIEYGMWAWEELKKKILEAERKQKEV